MPPSTTVAGSLDPWPGTSGQHDAPCGSLHTCRDAACASRGCRSLGRTSRTSSVLLPPPETRVSLGTSLWGPGCLGVPRGSVSVSRSPQSQWAISKGWCIGVRVLWRLKRGESQWLELLSLGNAEIQSSRSWAGSSLEGVRAGTATKCRIRKSFWSHVFPCAVRYKCTNVCPGIYMSRCVQACVSLWVAEGQWP